MKAKKSGSFSGIQEIVALTLRYLANSNLKSLPIGLIEAINFERK